MLPLYLLTAAKNQPILVELKTGETYNGNLTNCDSWMNLTLHDVIQTNADGDEFAKIAEIYIKGMHIKYLRIPDQIMDRVKEQQQMYHQQQQHHQHHHHYGQDNRNRFVKRRGGDGRDNRGDAAGGRNNAGSGRNNRDNGARGGRGGQGGSNRPNNNRRGNQ
ncbi:LSM domain family protein [Candida parapsilosis]|uniref:LSM complex subunit LSM4 n=2 Tax=Candida parapsilosis TaxID=5480 RepID=G8BKK4_CANPC|nr:uncharacterized protein CPAR2_702830 [Candida parapsilosis]KAF6042155.1 LSM domain family protein [Candida parapsilosis]KAF6042434.1 LSM domain family protein [Candida parapsilosis]KAF6042879.1 LSM domain family protein [Candida parapsilosis]KAF6058112.1 LSM domain family protein [Candida parapsilosis]KAI5903205.1 U6 snRNA-associated Sm-like protein LSm4 [Candida parapsilosis]